MVDLHAAEAILARRVARLRAEQARKADAAIVRRMRERKAGTKPPAST